MLYKLYLNKSELYLCGTFCLYRHECPPTHTPQGKTYCPAGRVVIGRKPLAVSSFGLSLSSKEPPFPEQPTSRKDPAISAGRTILTRAAHPRAPCWVSHSLVREALQLDFSPGSISSPALPFTTVDLLLANIICTNF